MQSTSTQKDPLLRGMPDPDRALLKRVLHLTLADVGQAVGMQPSAAAALINQLAQIAAQLPVAQMSAVQKATLRRIVSGMPASLQRQVAAALRMVGPLLGNVPSADAMDSTVQSQRRYEALRGQAARGMTLATNLRALVLGYAWFIINDTLTHVTQTMDDPQTTAAERELYRAKFSALLQYKETILGAVAAGRTKAKATRTSDSAEATRLQSESLVTDVATAVKNGWPLDPDALAQAATYYYQQMRKAAPTAAAPAAAANSRKSPR